MDRIPSTFGIVSTPHASISAQKILTTNALLDHAKNLRLLILEASEKNGIPLMYNQKLVQRGEDGTLIINDIQADAVTLFTDRIDRHIESYVFEMLEKNRVRIADVFTLEEIDCQPHTLASARFLNIRQINESYVEELIHTIAQN